ncbi:MAG: sulfatase-like hydrolase/transferase [Candidatus Moranbacteria bacterium]|jgi:hypothetical protein|nr:sulfatase-like hydrolase/transferase [Candidatus Moranbacteria bacterium]
MEKIPKKINKLKKFFKKEFFLILISLTATPFIIFINTSAELYLRNRIDLDDKTVVLVPFLLFFVLTLFIGCLIYYYSKRDEKIKIFLFTYYISGPAFLAYSFIRQAQFNDFLKALLLSISVIAFLAYLYKKAEMEKVLKFFLWFSIIMIVSEILIIFSASEFGINEKIDKPEISKGQLQSRNDLPNVYHIIFDEFQTDMFELTLDEDTKKKLAGFTYYPENKTVYGRTGMSLPTIFTGLSYDYDMPQIEYQKQAFNSEKSLLYWLKEAGYETNAFSHKVYKFDLELFDSFVEHKENADAQIENASYIKTFLNLWAYANFPKIITKKIIAPESFEQIKAQNTLSGSAPIINYESFKNIQNDEEFFGKNKYFYVHLIFPHFPYVFRSDCSYDSNSESTPLEQSKCATKMIVDFLNKLEEKDVFDDSLIIIQSDHGARFKVENDELIKVKGGFYSEEWSLARSKALLLVKTPDKKSSDFFSISDEETSLLDITPTILDVLDIESNLNTEGISLNSKEPRKDFLRYYHFFDKKGPNEFTDKLSRYIIDGDDIKFEKDIYLNNR